MTTARSAARRRRGNAVLVVTTLGCIFGFGTLSIDLGLVWLAKIELQQAVDDASLSGVSELDGTAEGIERAEATARAVAAAHTVLGQPVDFAQVTARVAEGSSASRVEVGRYDDVTGEFVPWSPDDDPHQINAVQVERDGQQVPAGLGAALFGKSTYAVDARSRTRRRLGALKARSTDCFLPLAVPDCHLTPLAPDFNPAPFTFTFSPSPTDAVAWADPDQNPNANDTRAQLEGMCEQGSVSIGDPVFVNEGSKTSALHTIRDILNDNGTVEPSVWDTQMYGPLPSQGCAGGTTSPQSGTPCSASNSDVSGGKFGNALEGPVFLIDGGSDCGNVSFTHTKVITGIAWGVIYDVRSSGGTKYISMLLDVKNPHLSWGEGAPPDADDPTNVLVPSRPEMLGW
jgi:hypothetical protein